MIPLRVILAGCSCYGQSSTRKIVPTCSQPYSFKLSKDDSTNAKASTEWCDTVMSKCASSTIGSRLIRDAMVTVKDDVIILAYT